jgi:hypothetical protein
MIPEPTRRKRGPNKYKVLATKVCPKCFNIILWNAEEMFCRSVKTCGWRAPLEPVGQVGQAKGKT